jgi:hypothetical protein
MLDIGLTAEEIARGISQWLAARRPAVGLGGTTSASDRAG